jgi:hypothetical protein
VIFIIISNNYYTFGTFPATKKTKGGLISFNSFLFTSKNRTISHGFVKDAARNRDLVGILFIMKSDPSQSTKPFSLIRNVSYLHGEDESSVFNPYHLPHHWHLIDG